MRIRRSGWRNLLVVSFVILLIPMINNHGYTQVSPPVDRLVPLAKNANSTEVLDNKFRTDYFEYPETGVEVGRGWNSIDGKPSPDSCILFQERGEQGHEVKTSFHELKNKHHLNRVLNISASAKTADGSNSASVEFSEEIDFKTDNQNLLVKVEVDAGDSYASPRITNLLTTQADTDIALKEKYKNLLDSTVCKDRDKDKEEKCLIDNYRMFLKSCGDSYVAKINRGGELFINYQFDEKEYRKDKSLKISLKASGFGATASAEQTDTVKKFTSNSVIDFHVYQRGGPKLPIPVNLEQIYNTVHNFVVGNGVEEFVPKPYSLVTVSYNELPSTPKTALPTAVNMSDIIALNTLYKELGKQYMLALTANDPIEGSFYDETRFPSSKPPLLFKSPNYFDAHADALSYASDFLEEDAVQKLNGSLKKDAFSEASSIYFTNSFLDSVGFRRGIPFLEFQGRVPGSDQTTKLGFEESLENIPQKFWAKDKNFENQVCGAVNPEIKSADWANKIYAFQVHKLMRKAFEDSVPVNLLDWENAVLAAKELGQSQASIDAGEKVKIETSISVPIDNITTSTANNVTKLSGINYWTFIDVSDEQFLSDAHLNDLDCWKSMSLNTWDIHNVYNITSELETIQLFFDLLLDQCFTKSRVEIPECSLPKAYSKLSTKIMEATENDYTVNDYSLKNANPKILFAKSTLQDGNDFEVTLNALNVLSFQDEGLQDWKNSNNYLGVKGPELFQQKTIMTSSGITRERLFNKIYENIILAYDGTMDVDEFISDAGRLFYYYKASLPLEKEIFKSIPGGTKATASLDSIYATRKDIINNEIVRELEYQNSYFCSTDRRSALCLRISELLDLSSDFHFRTPAGFTDKYSSRRVCRKRKTRKHLKVVGRRKKSCHNEKYHSGRNLALAELSHSLRSYRD